MKRSRRLKVNIFPFPSSSRSEGASQGYQLGSGPGGKAVRVWGWGARAGGSAPLRDSHPCAQRDHGDSYHDRHPQSLTWERAHTQIHGCRNTDGGPNLAAGGCSTAENTPGALLSLCSRWALSSVRGDLVPLSPVLHQCHRGTACALSPLHPARALGKLCRASWLGGCEMSPRLCCSSVLMSLM